MSHDPQFSVVRTSFANLNTDGGLHKSEENECKWQCTLGSRPVGIPMVICKLVTVPCTAITAGKLPAVRAVQDDCERVYHCCKILTFKIVTHSHLEATTHSIIANDSLYLINASISWCNRSWMIKWLLTKNQGNGIDQSWAYNIFLLLVAWSLRPSKPSEFCN